MTGPAQDQQPAQHGPDEDCPSCYECPGCGGGDGSTPRNPVLDRSRPGVVILTCGDCNSSGYLCPNYDPAMTS